MLTSQLNRSRRMGVEVEVTVPLIGGGGANDLRQMLAKILSENGLPAVSRPYGNSPVPAGMDIAVEHDGSIRGETQYRGIEWVPIECKTRILAGIDDYDRVVGRLMEILRYVGARVNSSTGHHIHVEFGELRQTPEVIRSFYNIAHRVEPVVFGLVAPSRRDNNYCRRLPDRSKLLHDCRTLADYQTALQGAGSQRYWAVNMTHLFSSGPRVEFRHHQGTLDFAKAKHWRNLCLRMIDHSIQRNCKATKVQLTNDQASLMRMLVTLGFKSNSRVFKTIDPELQATCRYLKNRWEAFNLGNQTGGAVPESSDSNG